MIRLATTFAWAALVAGFALVTKALPADATTTVAAGLVPAQAEGSCDRCKPASAQWDWKSNGYALGADADAARAAAAENAVVSACAKAQTFLAGRKLSCAAGCEPGQPSESCDASEAPKCQHGSYAQDKGMWTFVCRKVRSKTATAAPCDEALAQHSPGFGMCDAPVRAVRSLGCRAPGCD